MDTKCLRVSMSDATPGLEMRTSITRPKNTERRESPATPAAIAEGDRTLTMERGWREDGERSED